MTHRRLTSPAAWLALSLVIAVPAPPLLAAMHALWVPHVWCPVHETFEHREQAPLRVAISVPPTQRVSASLTDRDPAHVACEQPLWLERCEVAELVGAEGVVPWPQIVLAVPTAAPTRSLAWRLLEAPKLSPPFV